MKILICPCEDKKQSFEILPEVINVLAESGATPMLHQSVRGRYGDERAVYIGDHVMDKCDMVLTIGGDGMMLKWGKKAACAGKPLVGINTGRLGFMTAVDSTETDRLKALCSGSYTLSRRMMLDASLSSDKSGKPFMALNDIVMYKNSRSKLPEFNVKINGITVSKLRADGLIFSTPTGSTAYALSAGGPIIEPSVECIQMTPLCAHTLLNRPMIFGGNDTVTVTFSRYEGSKVNISVDGGEEISFSPADELTIKRSGTFLDIVGIGENSFYNAVSSKLMTPYK